MKTILSTCISILAAVIILNYLPVNGEERVYEETIRLHVIAESDSDIDQSIKLKVRDSVLNCVSSRLEGIADHDKAYEAVASMSDEIEDCASQTLISLGAAPDVKVELGQENYPVRHYDDFTLPAGTYDSLRVTIGSGKGHNWWCVLFPSVCVPEAVEVKEDYLEAGFTPEQYKMIENKSEKKYKVRFRILEILSDIVGFDY